MRLHDLTVTAFGPFAGTERVDFDVLNDAGLFLLSGATGAGKTSILDAVCFALYGQVPGARGVKALKSQHSPDDACPEVVLDFSVRDRRFVVRRSPEWTRPKRRGDGVATEKARASLVDQRTHALADRLGEVRQRGCAKPVSDERALADRTEAALFALLESAEATIAGPPDDGFVPVFGAGPDDVRIDVPTTPAVDLSKLPPPIALDAIGFAGDWPALAVSLGLTGVVHQLAFNSELTELDGEVLVLSVPVPQYADATQVAKLKGALAERLGKALDVRVTVGPARRTAAVLEAAARAERQREAEREIGADPFVQSLIRDFGASIVPGSVKPIAPDIDAGAGAH